jgi:tRNA(Ile)-lysidine synthase
MVSGGSDSLALMMLAHDWAAEMRQDPDNGPVTLIAITVDHGLRPESAAEAEGVAKIAHDLGIDHVTLQWKWDGVGNLQAAARAARYSLVQEWRRRKRPEIGAILVGHTRDDQAETFLMRLSRGSGVEGLSAMKALPLSHKAADAAGAAPVIRPILWASRADLRAALQARRMQWIDDPSNDNEDYLRVRTRKAMRDLAEIGLDVDTLTRTADHMARASVALWARAADVARDVVTEPYPGILRFDLTRLERIEEETQLRLLAHGIGCLTQAPYRPRLSSLEALAEAAYAGRGATLQGVQSFVQDDALILVRELRAVADYECPADGASAWDGRWRIKGRRLGEAVIRPMGAQSLAALELPKGLPKAAFQSYPALWAGQALVAVPYLAREGLCAPQYDPSAEFHRSILSH